MFVPGPTSRRLRSADRAEMPGCRDVDQHRAGACDAALRVVEQQILLRCHGVHADARRRSGVVATILRGPPQPHCREEKRKRQPEPQHVRARISCRIVARPRRPPCSAPVAPQERPNCSYDCILAQQKPVTLVVPAICRYGPRGSRCAAPRRPAAKNTCSSGVRPGCGVRTRRSVSAPRVPSFSRSVGGTVEPPFGAWLLIRYRER